MTQQIKNNWTTATAGVIDASFLNSLAASSTFIAGAESPVFDNSSNKYLDCRITGKVVMTSSNNQAGQVRIYAIAKTNDSDWPDVFDGTASAETFTSVEIRDSVAKLATAFSVTSTAGRTYPFEISSIRAVFSNFMPKAFALFVTGDGATSTNAQFASSGHEVTAQWTYQTIE